MNEVQERVVEEVKDTWARACCVYEKIVEKDGVVFMVLENGTALSVDEEGRREWVVKGWGEKE